jgi:hypothetical protein
VLTERHLHRKGLILSAAALSFPMALDVLDVCVPEMDTGQGEEKDVSY